MCNTTSFRTSGSSCRTLEEAIKLYKAKKLLTSSKSLYDMLEAKECPEEESRGSYYLAKSLYDLQMYHGAQHSQEHQRKGLFERSVLFRSRQSISLKYGSQ